MEINIGIIAIIVLAIAILAILASGYVKASPNKAYIISGIKREPKVLIGRAGIKIPFLEKKDELILNLGRVMGSNLERLTALENSQVKDFQYQLAVYIYNKGIGAGKFSAATAVGLFQSLIGLILVLLSDKFAKKLGEDGLL